MLVYLQKFNYDNYEVQEMINTYFKARVIDEYIGLISKILLNSPIEEY